MNTKNIFRTLFMAVLLLIGANSAKATETDIWNGEQKSEFTISETSFTNVEEDYLIRVYTTVTNIYNWYIGFKIPSLADLNSGPMFKNDGMGNWGTTWVYQMTGLKDGCFTLICSSETAQHLKKTGITITPSNLIVTKVTLEVGVQVATYTLTINIDGQTTTQNVAKGADLAGILPTPTKAGYTFKGWEGIPTDGKMPAYDLTVTALFKENKYIPATIASSTGYATFCSTEPLDFSGITTLKAYYAATVNDTSVVFKQITGTVEAGTGLLLKGSGTTQVPVVDTDITTPNSYNDKNLLKGVTNSQQRINAANLYVLVEKNGVAKFADTAAKAASVPAGKAYLEAPSSSNSRMLSFRFDDGSTTSINTVTTVKKQSSGIYNLQGQRVTTPGKGLYIINGKKVMIK